MRVLDLFSGLNGWSDPMKKLGAEVVTLDYDAKFNSDICVDILNVQQLGEFDLIVASPPCETFSVASIGKHWTGGKRAYIPKTKQAENAIRIIKHTVALISAADPPAWVIENPRGVLRKLDLIKVDPVTIWYCRYGARQAKPTDLWTNLPGPWYKCWNTHDDHEPAPRGAKTGTQGINGAAGRAKIPEGLALAVYGKAKQRLDNLNAGG